MGKHAGENFDLSDEAVFIYDEVIPDLLDDGKLTEANAGRLKHAGLSLLQGVAIAVALAVGPAVWSEIQGGNFDFPSLLHTSYALAVGAVVSYFRKNR